MDQLVATAEKKKPCPHCLLLITSSNLARHIKSKHPARSTLQQDEVERDEDDEYDAADDGVDIATGTKEAPTAFKVLPAAKPFAKALQAFYSYQLLDEERSLGEATTATSVAQHYLMFAVTHASEAVHQPHTVGMDAEPLDKLLLSLQQYSPWLRSGTLSSARPATRVAYCSRFRRFLQWRLAHCGSLLDMRMSPVRVGLQAVLQHVNTLRGKQQKLAKEDHRTRLTKEEFVRRGEWAELKELAHAIDVNLPRFNALAAAAARKDTMQLGVRSYCLSFVLAAMAVLAPPARPGFWVALNLEHYRAAKRSKDNLISSTAFKTRYNLSFTLHKPSSCADVLAGTSTVIKRCD
jgi:hypothetical protein